MGRCKNHPDKETGYKCFKHDFYLCESCLHCIDPDIYCTFRSSCIIFFIAEKGGNTLDKVEIIPTQNP